MRPSNSHIAYAYNAPVNFSDPTGHAPICIDGVSLESHLNPQQQSPNIDPYDDPYAMDAALASLILQLYGVSVDAGFLAGEERWNATSTIFSTVSETAQTLSETSDLSPQEAFTTVFDEGVSFVFQGPGYIECNGADTYGCGVGTNTVTFGGVWTESDEYRYADLFQHELGHVFGNILEAATGESPEEHMNTYESSPTGAYLGLGEQTSWDGLNPIRRSNDFLLYNEVFADMFLGWTNNTFADDNHRRLFMESMIEITLNTQVTP